MNKSTMRIFRRNLIAKHIKWLREYPGMLKEAVRFEETLEFGHELNLAIYVK